jgi:hypothetical protein
MAAWLATERDQCPKNNRTILLIQKPLALAPGAFFLQNANMQSCAIRRAKLSVIPDASKAKFMTV